MNFVFSSSFIAFGFDLLKITLKTLTIFQLKVHSRDDIIYNVLSNDEKHANKLSRSIKSKKIHYDLNLCAELNELGGMRFNSVLIDNCSIPVTAASNYKEEGNEDIYNAPKNDYCQYFVDNGQRPQNFIRDPGLVDRFEEYPKLRELIKLKDELIAATNVPFNHPMYLKCKLTNDEKELNSDFLLNQHIGSEFDVILIEPPLQEYQTTNGIHFDKYFSWDEVSLYFLYILTAKGILETNSRFEIHAHCGTRSASLNQIINLLCYWFCQRREFEIFNHFEDKNHFLDKLKIV